MDQFNDLKSYSFVLGAKYFCYNWFKLNNNYLLSLSQQNHY